ncbi:MAG: agmatinase [Thermoanaerobaculia bacterium]|nr:agmatinase [Thermoanaerobaculia bacterium]
MPDTLRFFDLDPARSDPAASAVRLLPIPFERTTSYGQGTGGGPAACLTASQQVELWDEELGYDPSVAGIATLPSLVSEESDLDRAVAGLESAVAERLEDDRLLIAVGGEHTVTVPCYRAAANRWGPLGVVQFDAHADLRDTYQGSPLSHACVMRRLLDEGAETLAIGIRSLSEPEAELVAARDLAVVWGSELERLRPEAFEALLDRLPPRLYLTFDVDYFDPSLVPGTGTPEPGGGQWYPTLALLRTLFRRKAVVAADVVELAPLEGQRHSEFLAAKLLYKLAGYWLAER